MPILTIRAIRNGRTDRPSIMKINNKYVFINKKENANNLDNKTPFLGHVVVYNAQHNTV